MPRPSRLTISASGGTHASSASTSTRTRRWSAPRSRSSSTVPDATSRPSLMIATASHRRSTSSSWCEENTTGTPVAARSASTPLSTSTPTGQGRRTARRARRAGVAHERRRQLHALLVAERQRLDAVSGAVGQPEPLDPRVGRAAGRGRVHAVQPREEDELVTHAHLRVQPALLRQVADARAARRPTGTPSKTTSPRSAASTPRMIRIVVVLPAPLGPTKPNIWPAPTVNDTPSSATTSP